MLEVQHRVEDDIVRVVLAGTIDGGESCRRIYDVVKENLGAGRRRFVFDLEGVDWINSLGVGFLVAGSVSAVKESAQVRLVGLSPRVDSVLRACGVVPHVWSVFESEEAALASFG
jgi:anti-anti-sigma factor